eukprot:TRINITY_DN4613_c0_g1_i3.p1 TRINITY_DN4613_c0_g1~~TRINITY_DN4613_c0_g1_i3.p1  ORF type:complete len:114 (+),score=6.83 TRINITY_DN4613_c0_g1_i3:37-342(+)
MNHFNQIHLLLNKKLTTNALLSCVVYPRASSLGDKVLYNIYVDNYTSSDIETEYSKDQDRLMSIFARGSHYDIKEAISMIDVVAKEAPVIDIYIYTYITLF